MKNSNFRKQSFRDMIPVNSQNQNPTNAMNNDESICPICGGIGLIRNGNGFVVDCECVLIKRESNGHIRDTLDTFKPRNKNQSTAKEQSQALVNGKIKNLVIVGSYGSGKSVLAEAIKESCIKEIGNPRGIELMDSIDFKRKLDYGPGDFVERVNTEINYLSKCPILILETVNTPALLTQYIRDQMTYVITKRMDNPNTKTVLTIAPKFGALTVISNQVYERAKKFIKRVSMDD